MFFVSFLGGFVVSWGRFGASLIRLVMLAVLFVAFRGKNHVDNCSFGIAISFFWGLNWFGGVSRVRAARDLPIYSFLRFISSPRKRSLW